MKMDYGHIDDSVKTFELIPAGEYKAEIIGVDEKYTKSSGLPLWNIKAKIIEGDYEDRLFWDMWTFGPDMKDSSQDKLRIRTKLNFKALGYDMSKPVDIDAEDIIGKKALVTLKQSSYKKDGEVIPKNQVPFDGWKRLEGAEDIVSKKVGVKAEPDVEDISMEDVPF